MSEFTNQILWHNFETISTTLRTKFSVKNKKKVLHVSLKTVHSFSFRLLYFEYSVQLDELLIIMFR